MMVQPATRFGQCSRGVLTRDGSGVGIGMTSRVVVVVQLNAVVQLRDGTDAGDDSDDDAGSVQMRAEAGTAVAMRKRCESLAKTIRENLRGPDGANIGYA